MNDLADLLRADACLGADLLHPVDDRVFRGGVGREDLGAKPPLCSLQHDIGKGAANVHTKPVAHFTHRRCSKPCRLF
jgi:hypothetical protein